MQLIVVELLYIVLELLNVLYLDSWDGHVVYDEAGHAYEMNLLFVSDTVFTPPYFKQSVTNAETPFHILSDRLLPLCVHKFFFVDRMVYRIGIYSSIGIDYVGKYKNNSPRLARVVQTVS